MDIKKARRIGKALLVSGIGIVIGRAIIQTTANPVVIGFGVAFIAVSAYGIYSVVTALRRAKAKGRL